MPLRGDDVRRFLDRAHRSLADHRDEIDALNVFPVPDGDTGTNLVFTLRSAIDGVRDAADDDVWDALVRGAMLGARGNSGVIFSQVLRGLAEALHRHDAADAAGVLADGLGRARDLAYGSVAEPLEGTILSAIRAAAEAAEALPGDQDLPSALQQVQVAVHEAVARTRHELDANRDAGVVDAGARGFEVFVGALVEHVTGAPIATRDSPAPLVERAPRDVAREAGSDTYRFEVQYLLEAAESEAPALRERLTGLGDSVVVVAAAGIVNVHVHTNDINAAIDAGAAIGRPWRIEVTEFARQIADATDPRPARLGLGVVAVVPGPGLRALAEEAGAVVVAGTAGSLPSVAELLGAAARAGAENVIVLPGHPNVVPTARQAAKVADEEHDFTFSVVAGATSPPTLLAALAVVDPTDLAATLEAMDEAVRVCSSGEVVAAVRDADTPIGTVREGQYLVVVDEQVTGVDDDPIAAVAALAEACGLADAEVATLVVGADVTDAERQAALEVLEAMGPAEVEAVDGLQRPVRYFLGVE